VHIWTCGCGLRRSLPWSIRGRHRSSAYRDTPVTLPVPSTRAGTSCSMMKYVAATAASAWTRFSLSTVAALPLNRCKDFHLACAAVEVPCQGLLDLLAVRHRVSPHQGHGRQTHPWCTIAALGCPKCAKRVLQRAQGTPCGSTFNTVDARMENVLHATIPHAQSMYSPGEYGTSG
jgi:hypothetical protein